jgi:cyanophycin synthetase
MIEHASVIDSRRLLGPSRLMDRAGAVLDVEFAGEQRDQLIAAWAAGLQSMLASLGWDPAAPRVLLLTGGASLAFEAPVDVLFAATEINEWAWARALEEAGGPAAEAMTDARTRIRRSGSRPS